MSIEHETHINYDYSQGVVRIYTTRDSVKDHIIKRSQGCPELCVEGQKNSWSITLPIKSCRQPYTVVRIARLGGISEADIEQDDEGIDLDDAIASTTQIAS